MKVGIAGAGTIVPEFLEACKKVSGIQINSIYGRTSSQEKMEDLSKTYGIRGIFTDLEPFFLSDIEVVYVALPNHLHYEFARRSLEAGKHVILEKPFASNYQQAEELIRIAGEKKRMIFEAISNQYLPNYEKTKELLADLGDVKIVQLNYSQYSKRYDAFKQGQILPVFDAGKSGGALMDLGVYGIHFVLGLFGAPKKVHYIANVERGVDTSGIMTMEYEGLQCVIIGAKDCMSPVSINIQGDKGHIHSDEPANTYGSFVFCRNGGEKQEFALNDPKDRLVYELIYFQKLLKEGDWDKISSSNAQSLAVMKILDEGRKQGNIVIAEGL